MVLCLFHLVEWFGFFIAFSCCCCSFSIGICLLTRPVLSQTTWVCHHKIVCCWMLICHHHCISHNIWFSLSLIWCCLECRLVLNPFSLWSLSPSHLFRLSIKLSCVDCIPNFIRSSRQCSLLNWSFSSGCLKKCLTVFLTSGSVTYG